jgi:hypothetical protein
LTNDPLPSLIRRQLLPALATLILGVAAASLARHVPDPLRFYSLAAALLLIAGLSWTLTSLVRLWAARG